ncbi:MFS transporter [Kribbella aluminosa]|uniref:MFS transporter n=1 Tax=Kribbella aluminosa TaxID=416017 RepID=UPI001AE7A676|nr:MFS transporter [Kribbella aluminosa]
MTTLSTLDRSTGVPSPDPCTTRLRRRSGSTFSSLAVRNFRLFLIAHSISMTGLWVQRVAQDWLVLTLTHDPFAVGLVTAVQCLPTLLFGFWGGVVGDILPKRLVLLGTQVAMCVLAAVLAVLTLTGDVRTWHVFVIGAALGLVSVVDNPARQAFVVEMVGADRIRNATSLASSVFQLGAMVGPAATGFMIQAVGVGTAFTLNAASYAAPIIVLLAMNPRDLNPVTRRSKASGDDTTPILSILRSRNVMLPLIIAGSFGLFLPNLPVTIAASTSVDFHSGSDLYGLLTAVVACGSLCGALFSASRHGNGLRTLFVHAALLAGGYGALGLLTTPVALAIGLFPVGVLTMLVITGTIAKVQLSAPPESLGRVMGIYVLVALGSAALGGPLIGFVDAIAGARVGYLVAGAVPALVLLGIAVVNRPNHSSPNGTSGRRRG